MEKKVHGMRSISSRRGFYEGKSTCVVPGERGMNSANILSNTFSQLLRVVLAGRGVGTHREKYVWIGSEVPGSYSGTRERKAPPARSPTACQPRAQGQRPPSSKLARVYRGQAGDPDLWALLFKHFTKIKYTGTLEQTSLGMEASTLFQAFTFPKIFNFSMNCPFKTTEKYGK